MSGIDLDSELINMLVGLRNSEYDDYYRNFSLFDLLATKAYNLPNIAQYFADISTDNIKAAEAIAAKKRQRESFDPEMATFGFYSRSNDDDELEKMFRRFSAPKDGESSPGLAENMFTYMIYAIETETSKLKAYQDLKKTAESKEDYDVICIDNGFRRYRN